MSFTSLSSHASSIYGTVSIGGGAGGGALGFPNSTITSGGFGYGTNGPQGAVGATGATAFTGSVTFDNVEIDASTKMVMKVNGRRVPGTDKFSKFRDIFLSDYKLESSNNFHFHLLVWEKNFGDTAENAKHDYGCVLRPNDGLYFAFGSIESRNEFERWMAEYAFTFFHGEPLGEITLPVPRQGSLNGVFVPDGPTPISDPTVVCGVKKSDFTDWAWIAGHCQHQVYRVGTGWLFEKEAEAIYFKMRG